MLNRPPFGSHCRTLVAPAPTGTMPIGTLYLAASASPKIGQMLPPLPSTPGNGSAANVQEFPSKLETRPVVVFWRFSPQQVEFDWPPTTKTSPTPTCLMSVSVTVLSWFCPRTSTRYQPPAGSDKRST